MTSTTKSRKNWFGTGKRRSSKKQARDRRPDRRPRLERLEQRELMAVDIDLLTTGTLRIDADDSGGSVEVSEYHVNAVYFPSFYGSSGFYMPAYDAVEVKATTNDGESFRETFLKNSINKIEFRGSEKRDIVRNRTDLPSRMYGYGGNDWFSGGTGTDYLYGHGGIDTLYGGMGDDYLYGGSETDYLYGDSSAVYYYDGYEQRNIQAYHDGGNDKLWGNSGNDYMHGGGGDDTLKGGSGNDRLYGNHGNDELRGEGNNDYLYGQLGNDTLYGDSGDDWLYGHDGADGLFGGDGRDTMHGGRHADRILQHTGSDSGGKSTDTIQSLSSEDAVIRFRGGQARNVCGKTYTADFWTESEIERLDEAFAALHYAANGRTTLLKSASGDQLEFWRNGVRSDGTSSGLRGCGGGRVITLVDNLFDQGTNQVLQTTLHEIGHGWDEENDLWNQ
jgi:Ca2+-binding RTX toxin-like protein